MWALFALLTEYLLETVRASYRPRLNSQPQRTRRHWENFFRLAYLPRVAVLYDPANEQLSVQLL